MSPLLTLVLLICASAATGFNHCSTLMLGKETEDKVYHRQRTIGSHDYIYIPDQCAPLQKKLVGQEAIACDTVGYFPPTIIPFGAGSFSPLYVNCAPENLPCYELLTVSVTQSCAPAPSKDAPSGGRNINMIDSEYNYYKVTS